MLSPPIAFSISIVGLIILLRLKLHPGFAIFAGSLIISLLVLPLYSIPSLMLKSLLDQQTIRLLVIIASALALSRLMEIKGLLAKLAATMESISPRLALHLIPAVIGVVPMPAGALVSATASRDLAKRMSLTPEQSTFINYWFRHIWEFALPTYPALILSSVLLSIPLSSTVKILFPMTFLSVLSGAVISYRILKKLPVIKGKPARNIPYNLFKASWPILLLVTLILLGLDAMIIFPIILVLLLGQQRANWQELKSVLQYGLNLKMLLMLYAIMLYKATIESSGTAESIFSGLQVIGMPALVILAALPFLMGFATGFTIAFVGIAFPLLAPYIVTDLGTNGYALLLAFASGMMGILISPMHLCFLLSAEYFGASLTRVYRYILPLTMVIEAIVIFIYYIAA